MDDTDRQIVEALRADGRLSMRALAELVHISRASAYARVARLERDGVITGYAAQVGEMDDLIVQAATIKVAKLQVIVERLQDELLKAKRHDRRLGDELVRHENLLPRAKAELTAMIKQPIPWWEDDNAEAEEN